MREISVEELARRRASGDAIVLLDVRDPDEVSAAALPDAVRIPMREIPDRLGELDPKAEIAVLCHYGGRSGRVAQFLTLRGFANVHNVEGGIDEYALRVDPTIPRY
jgi:rhodanese-related sulfurtransferase